MRMNRVELVSALHLSAKYLPAATAKLMTEAATRLDATSAALSEAISQRDVLTKAQAESASQIAALQSRAESAEQALLLEKQKEVVVKLPDEINVLLNHLEDVLPDEAFRLINVKTWNAVSILDATGLSLQKGDE